MDSIPFPSLAGWFPPDAATVALMATGLVARLGAAVEIAAPSLLPGFGPRSRLALTVVLAGAALPAALGAVPSRAPAATWGTLLVLTATEACIGIALGIAIAALVGAVAWAGEILGGAAGLSWTDGVEDEAAGVAAGVPRVARVVALAAFLAAGGLEGTVAALVDGVRTLPVGSVNDPRSLLPVAVQGTATALALAVAVALPVLVGLLVFQVVAALALRVGGCEPGPGLLHAATGLVLLALLCHGAPAWSTAAGPRLLPALEHHLAPLPAGSAPNEGGVR